jgi:hypothetical protein
MDISYQSSKGHTTLTGLSDAEVEAKFAEMTAAGFAAFADTKIDEPVGPIRSVAEAHELGAKEIYMTAPLQGG